MHNSSGVRWYDATNQYFIATRKKIQSADTDHITGSLNFKGAHMCELILTVLKFFLKKTLHFKSTMVVSLNTADPINLASFERMWQQNSDLLF